MAIKISRSNSRITAIPPKNYGMAKNAQLELDHTIARANRQYLEAINVDGFDISFWHRCTEGNHCTCSNNKATQQNPGESSSTNTSVPDDFGEFSITVRDSKDTSNRRANKVTTVFGVPIGAVDATESNRPNDITNYEESWDELEKMADEEAVQHMPADGAVLFGTEANKCGICFGTGYTQAYNLYNGKRFIFDTTSEILGSSGFFTNRNNKPHSFDSPMDETKYIDFVMETPAFFSACYAVSVRNNTNPAVNTSLYYKEYGTLDSFQPLTSDVLNSFNGITKRLVVRVVPSKTSLDAGIVQFTHVEVLYQYGAWPKAQMPALSESTNFGIFDTIITTEFTLPPTLINVDKEDLVFETKHNKLWKITDYNDFKTTKNQVCGWTANARIVQDYEQVALLKRLNSPLFELSFNRLEAFQGLLLGKG